MPYWFLAPLGFAFAGVLLYLCRDSWNRSSADIPVAIVWQSAITLLAAVGFALAGAFVALFTQIVPPEHVRIHLDSQNHVVIPPLEAGKHWRLKYRDSLTLPLEEQIDAHRLNNLRVFDRQDLQHAVKVDARLRVDGFVIAQLLEEHFVNGKNFLKAQQDLRAAILDSVERVVQYRRLNELEEPKLLEQKLEKYIQPKVGNPATKVTAECKMTRNKDGSCSFSVKVKLSLAAKEFRRTTR